LSGWNGFEPSTLSLANVETRFSPVLLGSIQQTLNSCKTGRFLDHQPITGCY
jgi:hypothetical protein